MVVVGLALVVICVPVIATNCMLRLLRARPEATLREAAEALASALGWLSVPGRGRHQNLTRAERSRIVDEPAAGEG